MARLVPTNFPNGLTTQTPGPGDSSSAVATTEFVTGGGSFGTLTNYSHSSMLHWRAAVARVRAGSGRGKLLVLGDSTNMGSGSGSSGFKNQVGAFPKGWVQALTRMSIPGAPFNSNCFLGTQLAGVDYYSYDVRVGFSNSSWLPSTSVKGLGGAFFAHSNATTGYVYFSPTKVWDNTTIYSATQVANGSAAVFLGASTQLGTITTGAAAGYLASTFANTSLNQGTVQIRPQGDGNLQLHGVLVWDSTIPSIDVVQGAQAGATAASYNGSDPWSSIPSLAVHRPDLTVINLTINDATNLTPIDSYLASMQSLITAAKLYGDVLLVVGTPTNGVAQSAAWLAKIVDAVYTLAAANNCPVVSLLDRWVSYAAINPVMPYFDGTHPEAVGYQDIAQAVYEVLTIL